MVKKRTDHRIAQTPRSPQRLSAQATVPDLITEVLRAHGSGMKSGDIVRSVQELREGIAVTTIFPAIYRMTKSGRLHKRGERLSLREVTE